jgi:hypothetical protein
MNHIGIGNQPSTAQKRNQRRSRLQTRDNRWKWMAAAATATAGGVAQSQAGMVTITLSNNFISATGGNHLNADLTGDGQPDVNIANAFNSVHTNPSLGFPYVSYHAKVDLNGVAVRADVFRYHGGGSLALGSQHKTFSAANSGIVSGSLTGSIPVVFKDLHINGGALTKGSLEVTVLGKVVLGDPNERPSVAEVQLDSLTFHTPDNGSSLALLAMGAGGVLALRRWRAAQNTHKAA